MSILIGADFIPTETNSSLFNNGDIETLFGDELLKKFKTSDYRIFNLEAPLTDKTAPIAKNGPCLLASKDTINTYMNANVDLFTLANNHIMDQGVNGLKSTMSILQQSSIDFVGVGDNLSEARKPFVFEYNGINIGVYACVEHEFSIATDEFPGANPFDAFESFDDVEKLKKRCDKVIVLYHGGKEYYRYPSPMLQKTCRKFVDKGADLVLCQHSHCIGCEEKYASGTIVYGQGNFLFYFGDNEYLSSSLLVEIDEEFNISYVPLCIENTFTRLATEEKAKQIMDDFYRRSEEIKTPGFIEKEYEKFAQSYFDTYLYSISGKESFIFKVINKLMLNIPRKLIYKHKYDKKRLLVIQNHIECEAHRELLLEGIKAYKCED